MIERIRNIRNFYAGTRTGTRSRWWSLRECLDYVVRGF